MPLQGGRGAVMPQAARNGLANCETCTGYDPRSCGNLANLTHGVAVGYSKFAPLGLQTAAGVLSYLSYLRSSAFICGSIPSCLRHGLRG